MNRATGHGDTICRRFESGFRTQSLAAASARSVTTVNKIVTTSNATPGIIFVTIWSALNTPLVRRGLHQPPNAYGEGETFGYRLPRGDAQNVRTV